MRDLTKQFLSESERDQIVSAVQTAEKETSGEIVPMIVSASYHYPLADVLGGVTLALAPALLLTAPIGGWLWLGHQNMWIFIGLFTLFFIIAQAVVKRIPVLKRFFISNRELDEEVEEAAVTAFFRHGLYRTRDATGVLLFISVFERKVWVLADEGINRKVAPNQWSDIVALVIDGIKQNRQGEAICEAVQRMGTTLKEHFPIRPDDEDELESLIIEK